MSISKALQDNYANVFKHRVGFGARPAVVVVDFIRAYTTEGEPLYAPDVVEAVKATGPLLERAREKNVPVIYTKVLYSEHGLEGGLFVKKIPVLRTLVPGAEMAEIVPELEPQSSDVVIVKHYASAFFGTALAALLTSQAIDTVILVGCSTSGCIRATATDGMQHGFRVIIPRECVGDRAKEPHESNLFDIDKKYGDVVSLEETMNAL